jgi:hypothetical protein
LEALQLDAASVNVTHIRVVKIIVLTDTVLTFRANILVFLNSFQLSDRGAIIVFPLHERVLLWILIVVRSDAELSLWVVRISVCILVV